MWSSLLGLYFLATILSPTAASVLPGSSNAARASNAAGTLAVSGDAEPLTFTYQTLDPYKTNWIALYRASGGGPVNEKYVSPSLVWTYAPQTSGSVRLSVDSFEPGLYSAFFLARDGYTWLANPINVTVQAPPANLTFPVESVTLKNARQGDAYTAEVSGLVLGQGLDTVTFSKVDGDSWIEVAEDGTLAGTPDETSPALSRVTVRALSSPSSSSANLVLEIPIRQSGQRLVSDWNVMTFNLWHGGTQVNNYHEKQLRFILSSNVDAIAFQESQPDHTTQIGKALGWDVWQGSDVGIISRYPIAERYGEITAVGGVRINLNGDARDDPVEVNFWSAHLGYDPYGPYDFCFDHKTKEQVLARERSSGRTPQMEKYLAHVSGQLANSSTVPVILAGDFNAPSHLDYVSGLKEKNCGIEDFGWPTSVLPTNAGLIDTFRVAHPDPVVEQGTTWSPVNPRQNGDSGRVEPQDRIDFIYTTQERLSVVDSQRMVAGRPQPRPYHQDNEWTSDHAAVLTQFRLQ